jgi:hypothetical protein
MCMFFGPRFNTKWVVHSASNMTGYHPKHLCFKIACHKYGLVLLPKHENLTFFFAPLKHGREISSLRCWKWHNL